MLRKGRARSVLLMRIVWKIEIGNRDRRMSRRSQFCMRVLYAENLFGAARKMRSGWEKGVKKCPKTAKHGTFSYQKFQKLAFSGKEWYSIKNVAGQRG